MGICMRYTGNEENSKDILHDCFVKVFESINRFEYLGAGSLKGWLSRITVNASLTFLQKQSCLVSMDEYDLPDNRLEDEDDITLYEQVSDETIIKQIALLPSQLRVIFNLYIIDEMSHHEIAAQLGITEALSRVRLHRAKTLLAQHLKEFINNNYDERRTIKKLS